MVSNLKNILLDNLISERKVDELVILYNSNSLVNNQKFAILSNFFINELFIIDAVELYSNSLEFFKFKKEILVLYELIKEQTKEKFDNYINNMIEMGNFNENDEAFLWYVLNCVLHKSKSDYILTKFWESDEVLRMIGLIRVIEFGMDVNKYIKWSFNGHLRSKSTFDNNAKTFQVCLTYQLDYLEMNLLENYEFDIFYKNAITGYWSDYIIISTTGRLFKHDDKFYIGEYKKNIYIEQYDKIVPNNNVLEKNPFIASASKNLLDMLPFLNGDATHELRYNGSIDNGIYVKKDSYENDAYVNDKMLISCRVMGKIMDEIHAL